MSFGLALIIAGANARIFEHVGTGIRLQEESKRR